MNVFGNCIEIEGNKNNGNEAREYISFVNKCKEEYYIDITRFFHRLKHS